VLFILASLVFGGLINAGVY